MAIDLSPEDEAAIAADLPSAFEARWLHLELLARHAQSLEYQYNHRLAEGYTHV